MASQKFIMNNNCPRACKLSKWLMRNNESILPGLMVGQWQYRALSCDIKVTICHTEMSQKWVWSQILAATFTYVSISKSIPNLCAGLKSNCIIEGHLMK